VTIKKWGTSLTGTNAVLLARQWCLLPITLATQGVEIGRTEV
jgi:hypothetical protein